MQGPDGSVFTGGWNKDVKHGLGRKVYSNGDVYEVRPAAAPAHRQSNHHGMICACSAILVALWLGLR